MKKIDRKSMRLREHQQANLDFFRTKARALSLLPFGSGKSPIGVLRIGDLTPRHGRSLIVTTTGMVFKWEREVKTWGDPSWVTSILVGKRDRRIAEFRKPHDVAITNYEGLDVLLRELKGEFLRAYPTKVFDEIHRCKDPNSDVAKNSALIAHPRYADHVYGLTGLPVLESPMDLFAIMRVINPFIFGNDFEEWRKRYFHKEIEQKEDGSKGFPKWVPKPGAVEFLASEMHKISFRRERDEVEVTYPVQHFADPMMIDLTGRSRRAYDEAEKRLSLALRHQVLSLVSIYPRLEKLCQLSRGWCYDNNKNAFYFPERPVLGALCDYLEDVNGQGKVVIWAVRMPDMAMIADLLRKMGKSYRVVCGAVKSVSKRDEIVGSFNNGDTQCLIAHPRCVGEGIDLHANYSFRYSYRWSAMEWSQPIGRFARMISPTGWVHYTDAVVRDTVDEGIMASVKRKLSVGELINRARKLPWKQGQAGAVTDGVSLIAH